MIRRILLAFILSVLCAHSWADSHTIKTAKNKAKQINWNASFDRNAMKEYTQQLKKLCSFRYPLDDYFPETPVTDANPPKGELHHAAEDCFAPAGTPVYAIGDGKISFSGKSKGYGWLIIIDHPAENVYSLYGHLSPTKWKKKSGDVKKGELVAYLAVAEEGETKVSHIHFGLRMGQRKNYPRWGDARWMAGYTKFLPERRGWLKPSEIIGQTDEMKTWHTYLQKRDDVVTTRSLSADDFKITSGRYHEKDDLNQAISKEFGEQYRLADWNDILSFSDNIEQWTDNVGLDVGNENDLFISNDGYKIWLGRQYYISRFNNNKPNEYLAHDTINNDYVCLGSWGNLKRRVLAVKK